MPELMRRYVVMTMATEAPFDPHDPEGVFVLKPWKDPAAVRALAAYREHCYPELARDLDAWIAIIQSGPAIRGDVGRRNEPHIKAQGAAASRGGNGTPGKPARPGAARRPRAAAKRGASKGGASTRGASKRSGPKRTATKRKRRAR